MLLRRTVAVRNSPTSKPLELDELVLIGASFLVSEYFEFPDFIGCECSVAAFELLLVSLCGVENWLGVKALEVVVDLSCKM